MVQFFRGVGFETSGGNCGWSALQNLNWPPRVGRLSGYFEFETDTGRGIQGN